MPPQTVKMNRSIRFHASISSMMSERSGSGQQRQLTASRVPILGRIAPIELFTFAILVILANSIIADRTPRVRRDPEVGLTHLVQFAKEFSHLIIRDPRRIGLAHIVAIGNLLSQVGCSRAAAYARDQPC